MMMSVCVCCVLSLRLQPQRTVQTLSLDGEEKRENGREGEEERSKREERSRGEEGEESAPLTTEDMQLYFRASLHQGKWDMIKGGYEVGATHTQ